MIIIGIDPGTGASSPLGFCRFNSETKTIYQAHALTSKRKDAANRIHDISKQLFELVNCDGYPPADIMCLETTFLRGTGNNSYQQVIGASIATAPETTEIVFIANTLMKQMVGGHGKAEKPDVAKGAQYFFRSNEKSFTRIGGLIANKNFDITDALAIGIAGLEIKNGR